MNERAELEALIADIRPELLRYCARLSGSFVDGEDIVQDTLVKAYDALEGAGVARLRPWLFRIAHNQAIDHLRRAGRLRTMAPESEAAGEAAPPLEAREMTRMALSLFLHLSPLQRSAVFLKDVMGHSLDEIAEIHGAGVAAVKAALHRGRSRLREMAASDAPPAATLPDREAGLLESYVERFNARDFDAVRAMLAADVRLDLVGRVQRRGAAEVADYFTNYSRIEDWRLEIGSLEGRAAITVHDPREPGAPARYFVLLDWRDGRVAEIRDYRYARHVFAEIEAVTV